MVIIMKNSGKNIVIERKCMQRAKGIGVKRMGTLAAVLFLSVFVTACGSKKYLSDIKASDYVTLGNYIGIEASAQEPSVEEELERTDLP